MLAILTSPILLLGSNGQTPSGSAAEFIWISDVHFDPTANATLTDALAEGNVADWLSILESSPGRASKFGEDTDWPLLASSLDEIRKTSPQAQFVVVTGDIFVHKFRDKFNKTAKNHGDEDFRHFATKTFQFVMAQLESLAPGKPVLFTFGNNDGDCGDYELQPNGAFLSDTNAAIKKILGRLADKTSQADWSASGSYSVRHPALKHYRVISLNSVYFSPKYRNSCATTGAADPGKDEMAWLATKLSDAKARHEKVWLLFHIAPGIDGYATAHPKGGGTEKPVVPMWKPEYTAAFERLLEQYRDTVTISLAAHEHMDDFRLVDHSLVLLTPGLSPVVGQNPAFRVVTYRSSGVFSDIRTYYLSNLDDFDRGQKADWRAEYSFGQSWGRARFNFQTFNTLFHEVEVNPEMRAQWMTLYSVSHPEGGAITQQTFPWLFCAAGNMTEAPYRACLQRLQSQ